MDFLEEMVCSTAFVVSAITLLTLMLVITLYKFLSTRAERDLAILLAAERATQVRDAHQQLHQTLGSIQAQVWYLDTATRVVEFNRFTQAFLQMDSLQARGRPMMALLPDWHEPEAAQARNEQVMQRGEAILGTIESYSIGDKVHWVSVDRLPTYDADGAIDGMMIFMYDITPLKAVEEALRLQKMMLEAQSETSLDGIVVFTPDQRFLSFNQRFIDLWRLPPEVTTENNGRLALSQIGAQLADPPQLATWLNTFAANPTLQTSNFFRLQDGRILDWYSTPVMGDDHSHYGRVWYFRDVTETRKIEQALRESEARNRALVNGIPDLMFRVRSDGTFIDYQGAHGYTAALSPEQFLGRNASEVFEPLVAQNFMQKLQVALQSNHVQVHEYQMPMLNGELRSWEQRIVASGEDEILVIVRDISSRKEAEAALRNAHAELERRVQERTAELRAINAQLQMEVEERSRMEEALRNSEERLELAILGADLGLIDIDLQTGKAVYNERWAEIRGYPLDQFYDTTATWMASIHPDDQLSVTAALENHLCGRVPFFEQEYRVQTGNGRWRWVRCRGKVVNYDGQNNPLRFAGTQTDITEYKQLEQQLLHAQKMDAVGRLAGGVAHDFNNILTVIMSYSELMLLQIKGNERLRTRAEEIRKAAEKAARLTRQLLMFSRSETVSPILLDMNRLVVDVESMLERLIGEQIHLEIHLDPTISTIRADPGQIEQVLLNLVVNGRDAMPHGGTLHVTTKRVAFTGQPPLPHPEMQAGTYIELAVADDGCGMDPEVQKRIFEPFFTTKGAGKGTGLGLSTVFGIVKQNRGFIKVQSEVGEGTTFHIFFPALPDQEYAATVAPLELPQSSGVETILLVEDEAQIRDLAGIALENAGYTVLTAANGQEALQKSRQYHGLIHLMITDVIMPGMNGPELSRHLMAQRPSTRVLYISGYTDGELNRHELQTDQQALLRKPFTPALLTTTVRRLLDHEPIFHR